MSIVLTLIAATAALLVGVNAQGFSLVTYLPFYPRYGATLAFSGSASINYWNIAKNENDYYDKALILLGGTTLINGYSYNSNDVWASSDSSTWALVTGCSVDGICNTNTNSFGGVQNASISISSYNGRDNTGFNILTYDRRTRYVSNNGVAWTKYNIPQYYRIQETVFTVVQSGLTYYVFGEDHVYATTDFNTYSSSLNGNWNTDNTQVVFTATPNANGDTIYTLINDYDQSIWVTNSPLATDSWNEMTNVLPTYFSGATLYQSIDNALFLYGGYDGQDLRSDLLISLDGGFNWGTYRLAANPPAARAYASLTMKNSYLMIIAGETRTDGYAATVASNEVWRTSTAFTDVTAYQYSVDNLVVSNCNGRFGLSCFPPDQSSSCCNIPIPPPNEDGSSGSPLLLIGIILSTVLGIGLCTLIIILVVRARRNVSSGGGSGLAANLMSGEASYVGLPVPSKTQPVGGMSHSRITMTYSPALSSILFVSCLFILFVLLYLEFSLHIHSHSLTIYSVVQEFEYIFDLRGKQKKT